MQLKIPLAVRTAILSQLSEQGLDETGLAVEYLNREGFGSFDDVIEQVRADHGDAVAAAMKAGIEESSRRDLAAAFSTPTSADERRLFVVDHLAHWNFLNAPDAVFATALTYAIEQLARWYGQHNPLQAHNLTHSVVVGINDVLAKRSVPYRVEADFEVRWYGDETTYTAITEPALKALADHRLAGAESEYADALSALRRGKQKDLEDAIEESFKAVESTMKVLIVASGLTLTGKETIDPLIKILVAGNVIPSYADKMVSAAARVRNAAGGHGTGASPRHTPDDLAVACVAAAGVAITYLAGKLP